MWYLDTSQYCIILLFFVFSPVVLSVLFVTLYYKAVPLQPWTGPEGSRRLRFTDFKTVCT